MKVLSARPSDGYDPGRLFNALCGLLKLRTDVSLARRLEVPTALVRLIRLGEIPVTPELLVRMEEVSGWSGRQLRDLMGDRRCKFRFDEVRDPAFGDIIAEIYASAGDKKSC